jgi:hypothetical protein
MSALPKVDHGIFIDFMTLVLVVSFGFDARFESDPRVSL